MTRESRRELPYEAMLASGRDCVGRGRSGARLSHDRRRGRVAEEVDENDVPSADVARDYDVEHYVATAARHLRRAARPRASRREDFGVVFADPDQLALFAPSIDSVRPILTTRALSRIT